MRTNMKVERVRCNLTIKQVADAIDVHPNAVGRWESGTAEPSASNLIALSNLYGCTPEYLLDMTDERTAAAIAN